MPPVPRSCSIRYLSATVWPMNGSFESGRRRTSEPQAAQKRAPAGTSLLHLLHWGIACDSSCADRGFGVPLYRIPVVSERRHEVVWAAAGRPGCACEGKTGPGRLPKVERVFRSPTRRPRIAPPAASQSGIDAHAVALRALARRVE